MKSIIKPVLFSLVAILLIVNSEVDIYASEVYTPASISNVSDNDDMVRKLDSIRPDWSKNITVDENFKELWENEDVDDKMFVANDGLIQVSSSSKEIQEAVEIWNEAIRQGIVAYDNEKGQLIMTQDYNVIPHAFNEDDGNSNNDAMRTAITLDNTRYPYWNVGKTARENYNTIKKFYNDMVKAKVFSPSVDPWAATVSYWLALVRPYGDWDYKNVKGRYGKTYRCEYGGKIQNHHVSWVGNYNYGYTGKFLFDLDVLKKGSIAESANKAEGTETGELVDTMVFDGNSGQEPGVRHAYSSKTYTQLKTKNGNKYWYATGKSGSDLKHVKIGCVASYKVANNSNTSALIDSYKSHIVKSNNYVNQSTFYSSLAGAIALGSMAAELISEGLATGVVMSLLSAAAGSNTTATALAYNAGAEFQLVASDYNLLKGYGTKL